MTTPHLHSLCYFFQMLLQITFLTLNFYTKKTSLKSQENFNFCAKHYIWPQLRWNSTVMIPIKVRHLQLMLLSYYMKRYSSCNKKGIAFFSLGSSSFTFFKHTDIYQINNNNDIDNIVKAPIKILPPGIKQSLFSIVLVLCLHCVLLRRCELCLKHHSWSSLRWLSQP